MQKNKEKQRRLAAKSSKFSADHSRSTIAKRIEAVVRKQGRRPRILLSHLESDQPDNWTQPFAAALAEFGFDVDIGPTHLTPVQAARLAIDNDVHIVCVSVSGSANQPLVGQLAEALSTQDDAEIHLVVRDAASRPAKKKYDFAGVDLIVDFDRVDFQLVDRILDLLA